MDFKKHALLLAMIEKLRAQGSWTGKTHVQKAMFLVLEATPATPPFEFVLYKHGPYSFDIENELEQMKSYGAISQTPVAGYGVVLNLGENAEFVKKRSSLSPTEQESIARIAQFVGKKNVADLEKEATVAWIRNRENIRDTQAVAERIHDLKPHIPVADAAVADRTVTTQLTLMPKQAV
jgi:uncharacterized protein YwgA